MAVWVVRAGRRGEDAKSVITDGISAVDFNLGSSALEFDNYDALREHLLRNFYADASSSQSATIAARQLWDFAKEIRDDDLIVQPQSRPKKVISVGKVSGPYQFRPEQKRPHIRPVEWKATDIPRHAFNQELLDVINRHGTVIPVRIEDAESRINRIVDGYLNNLPVPDSEPQSILNQDLSPVDLEEQIEDRILARIQQKFSGVRLEYLVASILRAAGYKALETRRGPDGGVDVVAGRGEMGFDQPRLCVQVKSGRGAVDIHEYNRLQGNIQNYGAEHGLLVSLGDFTRSVRNENERSFFKIRLWGPVEIVDKLLETYDQLPDDIQQDVPLRNRRVLVESDL